MKDFSNIDFCISTINLAIFMGKDFRGTLLHKNRPTHGLVFLLDGDSIYHFDNGNKLNCTGNTFLYLPKGSSYKIDVISKANIYAVNFDVAAPVAINVFCFNVKNKQAIESIFNMIVKEWHQRKPGFMSKCKSLLYEIIYYSQTNFQSTYTPNHKKEKLKPMVEYIQNHYMDCTISITTLSELCGITESYLRRVFAEVYGISPIKYINQMKIDYATSLLKSGYYSVSEVSNLVGYCDISYFSRSFKKTTGRNPSEILREMADSVSDS